jgi:hypothetical protein
MTASNKVRHVVRFHIPFSLPLSLSCYRDQERGYSERDPSPRRKRAPSPPTDQRFEGWPLGRVRQPPQSTQALRLLLIRGSKAGPSEGFDSRLRALGLRAHYWSEVHRLAPKGFDSRLRACRARDDSGYVRYTTKARAMLPRYPKTFPRPAGAIFVTKSHQREASRPWTLSNGTGSGKSPAGTFGACLWATSRPLSNGARASTRITR